jgi:hypothetical protein
MVQSPLVDRKETERTLLQLFTLTNELNEKDEIIVKLKRREASLIDQLAAKEKVHDQDALVRLQLGKRLEQVLLDKEEAYQELEGFKEKLENIHSAMSIIDFSNSEGNSPPPPSNVHRNGSRPR